MIAQRQLDAQLRRVASALDTSVEDLLLHAPVAWWTRSQEAAELC